MGGATTGSSKDGIRGRSQLGKKVRRKTLGDSRRGEVSAFGDGSEKAEEGKREDC